MLNNQVKPGDRVKINNDNWDDVNKTGRVVDVEDNKCIVESEDGVTMTLSLNQVVPLKFLSE